jgi:LysM repeat protein
MFPNQTLSVGRAASIAVALSLGFNLAGCSMFHHGNAAPTVAAPRAAEAPAVATGEPQTVTEALGDLPADSDTTVIADTSNILKPSAPRSYVVKRGDTLWGLANMFLRDPYLWPEIWYVNPQVRNPHLIYPGDTLQLALGGDGRTALQLTRGPAARLQPLLRSTPISGDGPIATIPYDVIRAFLSRPGIVSSSDIKRAPYVYAIRDGHLLAGANNDVYVKKLTATGGERFNVMHIDAPLRDPDGGGRLGNMTIFAATAQVSNAGDPATANITESAREVVRGDILVSETAPDMRSLVPHAPSAKVDGHVIGVVNGVQLVGQYQIVALNRGTNHGVDNGSVLRVREADVRVNDGCASIEGRSTCHHWRSTPVPNEIAGSLLVFKTYDRMSYALVVAEVSPIHVGDRIGNQ